MKHSLPLNAFQAVRPRGPDLDIPALPPRRTNKSAAPMSGPVYAMDRNGRRVVGLGPRTQGAMHIETPQQSAASRAKSLRISKTGGN